jgi:predicted Zn-dependent protease
LDAIQRLIDRGHASEALQQLDTMAAANPIPPGVERLRGTALYSQGKLPEAEQAFADALRQDGSDREATLLRGITLFRMGRPAAAIPLLESVRSTSAPSTSTPADPLYVLALCYVDTRRYDDARGAFAAQFGFPADSAQAYLLAARMLLRREYLPIAQQFARKALELSPQLPLAHKLLGETELAGNHLDEAIQQFEAERRISPLEPSLYDRLGDAYTRKGDLEQARRSLQQAVLLDPNATGPFILLGKVVLKQGDSATAAGYLEHARSMDNQNFMTHSLLGQAYRQMGRTDDARRETETSEKLQAATAPKLIDVK